MNIKLELAFQQFLQQQNLEGEKLLLMVSGGVDSVVLLHVAAQVVNAQNLAVFHLNHNTREEAKDDENFVQNLCSKLNIKFYAEVLDPGIKKKPASRSRDQENQWRKIRKTLAEEIIQDFGAVRILTAHHATDLVETMIFRLTKGCGTNGLSPFDTSTKPFWQLPKQSLIDYALEHKLEWHEDATNLNTKFERNLIRAEVLPALRQITPNLEAVFVRESQTFEQASNFINSFFLSSRWQEPEEGFLQKCLDKKSITIKNFLDLPPILQSEFLRHIATKTPSQSELEDCLKWLGGNPAGNSQKEIGNTTITLKSKNLHWQS